MNFFSFLFCVYELFSLAWGKHYLYLIFHVSNSYKHCTELWTVYIVCTVWRLSSFVHLLEYQALIWFKTIHTWYSSSFRIYETIATRHKWSNFMFYSVWYIGYSCFFNLLRPWIWLPGGFKKSIWHFVHHVKSCLSFVHWLVPKGLHSESLSI